MRKAAWNRPVMLDEYDFLVQSRGIGVAFQPIVDLGTGEVVAYEALARPPEGSSFADATALFAEGYRRGSVGELDWVCRAAVFSAALDGKIPPELPVFVNVEPAALSAPCPADIIGLYAAATRECRFVVEVTERSLTDDPAELLAAVDRIRDLPAGVALDDVGAEPATLAFMSLVAPDVIKLDLSLIQAQTTPEIARIVNAVLAESERTGAVILAEGLESDRHLTVAQSMGATLGQGWLFGAPGPLPPGLTAPSRPMGVNTPPNLAADTPFDVAAGVRAPAFATRGLLAATSRYLENEVLHCSGKAVLLSSFQSADNFGPAQRSRYARLARRTVLTACFGIGMPEAPGAGIRGVDLHPDDPLCREWTVVVLGSEIAAALIARQTDGGPEFEAVITHDRDLVVAAARSLLPRLPAVRVNRGRPEPDPFLS